MVCTYNRYIHYCPREDSNCLSLKELGGEAEGYAAAEESLPCGHPQLAGLEDGSTRGHAEIRSRPLLEIMGPVPVAFNSFVQRARLDACLAHAQLEKRTSLSGFRNPPPSR